MKNLLCKSYHPIVGDIDQKTKIGNKSKRRFLQRTSAMKKFDIVNEFYCIYKLFPARTKPA